jgi:regulator of replication initiation timing
MENTINEVIKENILLKEENEKLKKLLENYNNSRKSYYEKNKELVNEKAKERLKKLAQENPDKLKEIKQGKKIVILHGDYSRTSQMKGCMSTPNIGIKKLLLTRFDIVEVNEFNTSKLYNKTMKEMENVIVRRTKHKKSVHEILTPKEETKCRIFVNRDVNACKNILLLGKCYLESQTRPEEFTRKVIKSEKVKKPKKTNK